MVCTFFGHRLILAEIKPLLEKEIIDLIENHNVNVFYVGNKGSFDVMVYETLQKISSTYPHIKYYVVLAYLPQKTPVYTYYNFSDTIYPSVLERTPPRFAISKRNKWMIEKSDFVITYVEHITGGAAAFEELAEKQGKSVIKLAQTQASL